MEERALMPAMVQAGIRWINHAAAISSLQEIIYVQSVQ